MTSRRIGRASFRGAYKAIFANASKDGILSVAHEYATPAAATASLHDPAGVRSLISQMRGHRTAPTGAPRSNAVSVAGTLTEESKRVPAYTVVWQHGRTLNLVLLFGIGTTVSQSDLVALAQRQTCRASASWPHYRFDARSGSTQPHAQSG